MQELGHSGVDGFPRGCLLPAQSKRIDQGSAYTVVDHGPAYTVMQNTDRQSRCFPMCSLLPRKNHRLGVGLHNNTARPALQYQGSAYTYMLEVGLQGYFAHKNTPIPLGPPRTLGIGLR